MKERAVITQELCTHIRILLAGGATIAGAARMAGVGEATVNRIKRAGFHMNEYRRQRMEETNRNKQRNKQTVELVYDQSIAEEYRREQAAKAEDQVEGQMKMMFPEDPDETFDRNVQQVLTTMQRQAEMFQTGMDEVKKIKEEMKIARDSSHDAKARLNNMILIIRDTLEMIRKELL